MKKKRFTIKAASCGDTRSKKITASDLTDDHAQMLIDLSAFAEEIIDDCERDYGKELSSAAWGRIMTYAEDMVKHPELFKLTGNDLSSAKMHLEAVIYDEYEDDTGINGIYESTSIRSGSMRKRRFSVQASKSDDNFYTREFPDVKAGEVKVAPQCGNYTVFIGLSDGTIAYQWCSSKVKAQREAKYARDTIKKYGSDDAYWTAEGYKIYNPNATASVSTKRKAAIKAAESQRFVARQRTALDGKTWWCVFDTKENKWSTKMNHGKYKTKKECEYAISKGIESAKSVKCSTDAVHKSEKRRFTVTASSKRRAIRAGYTPKEKVLWLFNADENQWVPWGTWSRDTVTEDEMYALSHRRFPNSEYDADYNYTDYMLLPNDGSEPDDGRPVRASATPKRNFTVKASCSGKRDVMATYRRYEDPYKLEKMLEEAEAQLAEDPDDPDLHQRVHELKDRINFAWQDDEFDEMNADRFDDDVYGKSTVTCTEKTDTFVVYNHGNFVSSGGYDALRGGLYDIVSVDEGAKKACIDYCNSFGDPLIEESASAQEVADTTTEVIASEYDDALDAEDFAIYIGDRNNGANIEIFDKILAGVNASTSVKCSEGDGEFHLYGYDEDGMDVDTRYTRSASGIADAVDELFSYDEVDTVDIYSGMSGDSEFIGTVTREEHDNDSAGRVRELMDMNGIESASDVKCGYDLGADTADDTYTVDSFFGYNGYPFRGLADGITTDDWSEVESWSHEHLLKGENVKIDGPQGVLEITADEYNQAWEEGAADFDINEEIVDYKRRIVESSTSADDVKCAYRDDTIDKEAVRELVLVITNDGDLYRQRTTPMIENLKKKVAKGKYDRELAVKLWQYLADEGVRRYDKEYGSGRGSVSMLNPATRRAIAEELRDYYEEQIMWDVEHANDGKDELTTL